MAASQRPTRKRTLFRRVTEAIVGSRSDAPNAPVTRRYPDSPFEKWGYDKADDAIAEAFESQTIDISLSSIEDESVAVAPGQAAFYPRRNGVNPIVTNRLFYRGDHWQNGDGWIGPHPEIGSEHFSETMQEIANIFTSKNVIRECVMRHALGVIGRNMQWGFAPLAPISDPSGKPPEDIQQKIQEATNLIRPWLQSRKIPTLLRDAICTLLLSERAGIQLVIPPGLGEQSEDKRSINIRAGSIEEALGYIYPEHPIPDNAAVVSDKNTMTECGVWRYTMESSDTETPTGGASAVTTADIATDDKDYVALCYVDQTGQTIIRVFQEDDNDPYSEVDLDLGGRIPMFEMRRAALITLQVQQEQRALNLAESMIPRTSITAGFMERMLIDAQLPGEPELDAEGNETGRWIEKPFYVGAGTTNFVESTEYEDEEGKIKRANARAEYRQPVSADGPIKASDKHYRSILDETGQLHVVMAGDSNPSGTSRLNARIEYLATLQLTQPEVESAFRFIVDTTLAMAEAMANKVGFYTKVIRAQCACRLDAGPLLPAERAAVEASIGKTISQETAMMLVGIEDVEAEKARMAMDPLSRTAYGSAVGDALNKLTAPGATLEGAARFIGVDDRLIGLLMSGDPGPMQNPSTGQPTGTGPVNDPKPGDPPSQRQRGPGVGGPPKKPLPQPATSSSGTSSGSGLPISGAK